MNIEHKKITTSIIRSEATSQCCGKMSVQTRTTSIHQWHFIRAYHHQALCIIYSKQKACVFARACKKKYRQKYTERRRESERASESEQERIDQNMHQRYGLMLA